MTHRPGTIRSAFPGFHPDATTKPSAAGSLRGWFIMETEGVTRTVSVTDLPSRSVESIMRHSQIKNVLEASGFRAPVESIRPLGGGLYNEACILECSADRYVLRIAPPDEQPKLFYEKKMMRSEPGIHRAVRSRTDVPAPEVVHHDFSRQHLDRDFVVMEFLPGDSGSFDRAELGDYVAQVHGICGEEYGYPDREAPTGEEWVEVFRTYVRKIFDDCLRAGAIDQDEHTRFLDFYDERWDAVGHEVQPRLLHLDLWSANILVQDGRISGILDFDRGMYGDPELEFAVLDTYGNTTPRFFEGYGESRPRGAAARTRRNLYLVYEIIKYAFIRLARGGSHSMARNFVGKSLRILDENPPF